MNWNNQKKPRYRQKKFIIPLVLVGIFIAIRLALPPVMLSVINDKLKDEKISPTLQGHVDNLSLSFLKTELTLSGITASLRENDKRFLSIDSIHADLSWQDIFEGDLVAQVVVKGPDFIYSNDLMEALKVHAEQMKKEDKKKVESPVRLARVDIKDAIMRVAPFDSLTEEDDILMSDIDARITNVTPTKELPKTHLTVNAQLLDSGQVKTVGEAELLNEPLSWSIDSEILKFDLTSLNRFLMNNVPLSFTHGKLDFFAEAKSENGTITGYLKPFVKNLDVVKKTEDFNGSRHFLAEIITAIGNITVKSDDVSATRVPFVFDGTLKTQTGEALFKAFQHGFQQEISRGIENSINLK